MTLITLLQGCIVVAGVTRVSPVNSVPDVESIRKHIADYPEIDKSEIVKLRLDESHIHYEGGANIKGELFFFKDHGKTYYMQCLGRHNHVPQEWIDASWPIMKRIEKDLIEKFGLVEIPENLKVECKWIEDPERIEKSSDAKKD